MLNTEIRLGSKRFFDDKNFPRGFAKSGDFTLKEHDILTDYGDTLQNLMAGNLQPENNEEANFLKVCDKPAKAKSAIERAWVKYNKLVHNGKKFYSLNGKSRATSTSYDEDSMDIDS
ncbi:DUF413 domain-containing protein [Paraferrimonas sp. SM1919]|uniref:DUF413 domain-containing protein n=1 Tax=Paraferrimonas sp. SM1919 TaxID=2662263 RepID=UPI0013D57E16|nr:DUF413 domain-containing protein [Paraferrimonas sp. SM1919]